MTEKGESNYAETDGSVVFKGAETWATGEPSSSRGANSSFNLACTGASDFCSTRSTLVQRPVPPWASSSRHRALVSGSFSSPSHLPCVLYPVQAGLISTGLTMHPIVVTFHPLRSLVVKAVTSDIADACTPAAHRFFFGGSGYG